MRERREQHPTRQARVDGRGPTGGRFGSEGPAGAFSHAPFNVLFLAHSSSSETSFQTFPSVESFHPLTMAPISLFRSAVSTSSAAAALERSFFASTATSVASTSRASLPAVPHRSFTSSPSSKVHYNLPRQQQSSASPASGSSPSDTARASAQMKRFWKSVSLRSLPTHHEVQLDGRSLRTPDGALLAIPVEHELLARLIVHEWNEQTRVIKSHALPLTSLAARAIDGFGGRTGAQGEVQDPEGEEKRRAAVEDMLRYAQTDTIW